MKCKPITTIQEVNNMTEENNEMIDLLKELVGRIKEIEKTVYNNDNILMKSGK